jgi:hypothetical protein
LLRTFATTLMLAVLAWCAACSSSSSVGADASGIDVIAPEIDAAIADASEEAIGLDAGR